MTQQVKEGELLPKVGRPRKEFKEEYCDLIIELHKNGKFVPAFCALVGISTSTFYGDWLSRYPELAEAYAVADAHGQAWLDHKICEGIEGRLARGADKYLQLHANSRKFKAEYGREATAINVHFHNSGKNPSLEHKAQLEDRSKFVMEQILALEKERNENGQ